MPDAPTIIFQSEGSYGWLLDFIKMMLSAITGGIVAYGVNIAISRKSERQGNIRDVLYLQTYLLYVFNSLDSINRDYIHPHQKVPNGNVQLPSRGSVAEAFTLDLSKYIFMFSLKENGGIDSDVAEIMKRLPEHLSSTTQFFELIRRRDSIKADFDNRLAAAVASGKYPSGVPHSALEPSFTQLKSLTDIIFVRIEELLKDSVTLLLCAKRAAGKYDKRSVLSFQTPGYDEKGQVLKGSGNRGQVLT